jgi:hypothetical protein
MKIRLLCYKTIEFLDLQFMCLIHHSNWETLALENGKIDATKAPILVILHTMQAM